MNNKNFVNPIKSPKSRGSLFLAWAHSENDPNFGDELGPYILSKITGMRMIHIPVLYNRFHLLMLILKRLATFKLIEFYNFVRLFFGKKYYIFLGSILQFYKLNGGIVWGAGLIDTNFTTGIHRYYAVRGPKSRYLLMQKGYKVPQIYGDPALILSRVYDKPVPKSNEIGIIPHIVHYEGLLKVELNSEMTIIDLKTFDIEFVIDEIRSCRYVLSSSLHGLIVAHAYNIPALWVNLGDVELMGNNVKFYDYFESLQIPPYDQIIINKNDFTNLTELTDLFDAYRMSILPDAKVLENVIDEFIRNAPPRIIESMTS